MNRIALIAITSLALGAVGADLIGRLPSPGRHAAKVIAAGYRAAQPDIDALDGNDAGYRWAERHAIDQTSACPHYSAEFVAGCQAWVQDEASGPPRRTAASSAQP